MNLFVTFLCGIFIAAGVFMSLKGVENIQVARQTMYWDKVVGVIKRSEISSDDSDDSTTYKPLIEYTYIVNGIEHQGQSIYIGDGVSTSDISYAKRFVSKYPVGKQVSISYEPNRQGVSVLEPGIQKATFIPFVFGIGFAFMGTWFYILFLLFQ